MSYLPDDEDGIRIETVASGSQITIPGTTGGNVSLKTITITNNEKYILTAQLAASCRLRTELITGGNRSDMEGYFNVEVDTGSVFGASRSYVEVHLSGTGGVTGATQGHPAGEGILLGGEVNAFIEIPSTSTRTFDVRYYTSAPPENLRTGTPLGYVQFLFGDLILHQKRAAAFDVTIT